MTNKISVRQGEKPLLVIDGAEDGKKLWLFDPLQGAFSRVHREPPGTPMTAYRRNDKSWVFWTVQPSQTWQAVTSSQMVALLDEMEAVVSAWQP